MAKFFKAIFYGVIGWIVFNFILFFGASFYLAYMGIEGELSATLAMVLRYASIALGVLMGIIPLLGGGRRVPEVREAQKMPAVAFRPQPPVSAPMKPATPPLTVAPKPAPLVLPKPLAPVPPPVMGTPFKPMAPQPVIPTPPKPIFSPPVLPKPPVLTPPLITSAPSSGGSRPTEFSLRPPVDSIKPPAPPPTSLPVAPKPPILSAPPPAPFKPATPSVPPVFQPPPKPFTPIFGAPPPKPPAGTPSDVHSTWPPRSV